MDTVPHWTLSQPQFLWAQSKVWHFDFSSFQDDVLTIKNRRRSQFRFCLKRFRHRLDQTHLREDWRKIFLLRAREAGTKRSCKDMEKVGIWGCDIRNSFTAVLCISNGGLLGYGSACPGIEAWLQWLQGQIPDPGLKIPWTFFPSVTSSLRDGDMNFFSRRTLISLDQLMHFRCFNLMLGHF